MATLTDSTNLTGTITLSKATGTKVVLDTDKKYLTKDIELTINAPTTTATVNGATVSYGTGWITGGSTTVTDSNLINSNIKKDITIFGVTGTYEGDPLDLKGYTIKNIVPLQTININSQVNNYAYGALITNNTDIIYDEKQYLITYDGVQYVCEGFIGDSTLVTIGDYRIISSNSTIARYMITPFCIGYYEQDDIFYVAEKTTGTHTIQIDEIQLIEENAILGSKTITSNGTYTASTDNLHGYDSVTINVSSVSPTLQAKTNITPTESSQTITPDNGYDALSSVQINAISSTYVGSGITQRSSSDLTASGATVTVPAGYYSTQASKSVTTMTLPTSAASSATSGYTSKATISRSTSAQYINIPPGYNSAGGYYTISATPNGTVTAPSSISGTSATISTGTNTITLTKSVSVTPNVTTAGYISTGAAGNSSVTLTASVTTKAAATITPGTSNQTIASGTYLTGTQTIAGDADLVASNIISTANIFGVQGSVVINKYYTGSSAPASNLGNNGDIYIQQEDA